MSADHEHARPADESLSQPRWILRDLRRRKVFRVMAAYGVGAWLVLQVVDILSEVFPLPNWTMFVTTIALALGFPIAAALSWAFQLTPEGVVLDIENARPLSKNRSRLIHFLDVIVICILLLVIAYLSYGERFERNASAEIRVAVLPFENLSNDESVDYLGEGIADDIRARLYGLPQLLLAARSSSASVFGKGLDLRTIGERLTVQHVIEGTVRKSGDRIRVTVQLVDTESGLAKWVKTYDARFESVLEMQSNISLVIASQLELLLSQDVRETLADNPTDDPVAFDIYLQAQEYMRRPRSLENVDVASSLFQRAIGEDPGFALGYAGLCNAAIEKYTLSGDTDFVASAERHCALALELDAELAEVHSVLGRLYLELGRIDEAESTYMRALAIDPRSISAFSGMGKVFIEKGQLVEAEERFKAAIEVRPGNWQGYNQLAEFLLSQGRFDEAIENYEKLIELSPDNAHAYNDIGAVYYMLGEFDKAAELWRASLDIEPGRAAYSNIGSTYYLAGNFDDAAAMFARAVEETEADYRLWGNLADAQRFIDGGKKLAEASYRKAIELALEQQAINPNNAETLTNLAWYNVNVGSEQQARAYLERAQAQPNRDLQQIFFDALICTLLGEAERAESTIMELRERGFPESILGATPEFKQIQPAAP